ncbi:MAG: hypothetical protein HYV13_01565 [Candidatus Doudnabacteria bacterium]|nr:hypothetical protein [Candidatus Doudnabacteria bacterium]
MKKNIIISIIIVLVVVGAGVLLFKYGNNPKSSQSMNSIAYAGSDNDVISQEGIHWHPKLVVYINGEIQEIPANVGIGTQYSSNRFYDPMMQMTNIHTHDNSGQLHWEVMSGPVRKGDIRLKNFFEIWGKTFNSSQIFDSVSNDKLKVKMFVNGQVNEDYENYIVKDKDKIEMRYE